MIPLVAVSGAECRDALSIAGFTLTSRSLGSVTMRKGDRVVVIPEVAMLCPEELTAMLRDAGVRYSDFLDLLSEAPTDPAISRTRLIPTTAVR